MQDKPQDWNSRNTNQYWTRSLGSITTITRVDRSSFCNQHLSKNSKKSPKLRKFGGDATSIRSEIERNKVNRRLFRMPEQVLHKLAEANDTWIHDSFPEKPGTQIGISVKNRADNPISRSREPGNSPIFTLTCHFDNCCFFHCIRNWLGIKKMGQKMGSTCSWARCSSDMRSSLSPVPMWVMRGAVQIYVGREISPPVLIETTCFNHRDNN